ncbi:MAG: DUF4417 domain-containing protein, partial [Anaerovoracaceae bacterium]
VHFYEPDSKFERLWKRPRTYINKLKRFDGVITPDFSLYREMPLCMQVWNTYRNRALGYWLSKNEIPIIPNVRWGDERTYDFCFDGVNKNSIVAIGTHGCIKRKEDKYYFQLGLLEMLKRLSPHSIIVFGAMPSTIFDKVELDNIKLINFESECSSAHKMAMK